MEIKEKIIAVMTSLQSLEIKGTESNLNILLGSIQYLREVLEEIDKPKNNLMEVRKNV